MKFVCLCPAAWYVWLLQVVRTGRQLVGKNGRPYDVILIDEAQVCRVHVGTTDFGTRAEAVWVAFACPWLP